MRFRLADFRALSASPRAVIRLLISRFLRLHDVEKLMSIRLGRGRFIDDDGLPRST